MSALRQKPEGPAKDLERQVDLIMLRGYALRWEAMLYRQGQPMQRYPSSFRALP